jgi:hypothetical protein
MRPQQLVVLDPVKSPRAKFDFFHLSKTAFVTLSN